MKFGFSTMLINFLALFSALRVVYAGWFTDFFGAPTDLVSTTGYVDNYAILNCTNQKRKNVSFYRQNLSLPSGSIQKHGILYIPYLRIEDAGIYICKEKNNKGKQTLKIFFLTVFAKNSTSPISELQTATPRDFSYIKKEEKLNGQKLALQECSNETLYNNNVCLGLPSLFECNDGQKLNRSLRCNRKIECSDGSDELNCEFWPPKITRIPELKKELFCGTHKDDQFDMLRLECEFVGLPEPLIKWKKYEGHVPSKCQQISLDGYGILLCPNFTQSDQGAYTCVAENSVGSSESQPKSIVKCKNFISCNGFRIKNEEDIEHCLECYCSGKTDKCQNIKSSPTTITYKFPDNQIKVRVRENGEILQIPSEKSLFNDTKFQNIKYCELSSQHFNENSLLKSYGRNVRIPRYTGKVEFLSKAPDLIIQGNGLSLFYDSRVISSHSKSIDIRFWPGNWHHLNKSVATREDIMIALSNVDRFLIRCEYKKGNVEDWSNKQSISLQSSTITDSSKSVSYLEKCHCPEGYVGLSCEACATGYKKKQNDFSFVCEKILCDSNNGYYLLGNDCVKSSCNLNNSVSLIPESDGRCKCKEGATGPTCDETFSCENGYFRAEKSQECIKCWCSGVTDKCSPSSLYRTEISSLSLGGYNSSNGRNFWLLPTIFSGNKLTSYGGHIKYAMKYISNVPKQEEPLTVELLTVNDVTLSFRHANVDKSVLETEKTWIVPIEEKYWIKSDKSSINRTEFLTVLTKLKAIYVESPYHLSSGKVNLTWVRMSDAKDMDPGGSDELALEVEQCFCPPGYTGLSCENCEEGYYKEKNSSRCLKCDCDNCDPIEGCLSCPKGFYRDNPATETKPICKPCDCNGKEVKCGKDSNNNTYCLCQAGYTGLRCENFLGAKQNSSHLTIKISPEKVTNNLVGTETAFNCSYDSGEKLRMSFIRNYRDRIEGPFAATSNHVLSKADGFEGFMIFDVLLEEDLTDVICYFYRANGKESGQIGATIQSTGMQPVKITNCYSDFAYVKETKSKDLICLTMGSPKPITTWYVKKANGSRQKVDSTDGVYSIEAVKLNQNGTMYICEAENSVGDKDICTVTLIVEQNCDVVHIVPNSLTVNEGETINLQCKTTANSTVTWSRPSGLLPVFRAYEKNGNLSITEATLDDAGNYSCSAMSLGNKPIIKSVWVNVTEKLVPPSIYISSDDVVLDIGQNFQVNCWSDGKPIPTVAWKKLTETTAENVKLKNGDLTITSATFENAGIYECEASSKAGKDFRQILIDVKDKTPPKLEVFPSSLKVIEGQSARIECIILEGNPIPSVQWFRERKGTFELRVGGDYILTIQNISRYDAGIYQCVGYNEKGHYAAYAEIDVLFPPEITVSENQISVYENQEITVKCTALGNPLPKLMWINEAFGKKRQIGDNDVLANLKLHQPELKISFKASPDLRGIVCVAFNEVGEVRQTVSIRVLPELVVYKEDVEQVPIGSYHELLCHGCSGKLKWKKLNGHLIGDECEIPNGLMIPSVQIQHNATYVCQCSTDDTFKKTFVIIVTGFAPKFSQDPKSYLVLPVNIKSTKSVQLDLSFTTNRNNGVLVRDENNRFYLSIQGGKLVLEVHFENEKHHYFTSMSHLTPLIWYSVKVTISPHFAKIIIYDSGSLIIEEKTVEFQNADGTLFSTSLNNFFVGGTKHKPKSFLSHHAWAHTASLDGCISRLIVDGRPYDLIKDGIYSASVNLCQRCSEPLDHCNGKGKCLDAPTQLGFICVCPDDIENQLINKCPASCFGENCDSQQDLCAVMNPCNRIDLNVCTNKISNLSCRCAVGYKGLTCEKEERSSFCVSGNGYIKLPSKYFRKSSLEQPEVIEMKITLEKPKGLLFWRGNFENYIALYVHKKQVHYEYYNQGVSMRIIGVKKISLRDIHHLIAKRMNDSIVLQVDSDVYSDQSIFTTNRVSGDFYLGGVPDDVTTNYKYGNLNGCIHSVSFNGHSNINFKDDVLEATYVNVKTYKLDTNDLNLRSDYKMDSKSEEDELEYDY